MKQREESEAKDSEFHYPSLDNNPPDSAVHHLSYSVRSTEYGVQPVEQPSFSLYPLTLSEQPPPHSERAEGTFPSSPFAYPRQQQPAFVPSSPIYAPSSPNTAHLPSLVSPPATGRAQGEGPGPWWYMPGQSPLPSNSTMSGLPVQPFSQASWSTQQHLSPSPSPSSSRFSQSQKDHLKPLSRRTYHPNPPAARSEWVMWVGNVPGNAEHDELWRFFTQPHDSGTGGARGKENGGVISIFLISRSRCAFVNYETDADLQAAIKRFDGSSMRAADPRAARLVCRVRGNSGDLRSGVGGQRGTGLHKEWVRKQTESPGPKQTSSHSSIASTPSNASTTSSFLETHFPQRFFILKSLTQDDINTSVHSGLWATQRHNEDVLDRAFRTAKDVFLIFSVNKSGGFCGYARMQGTIGNDEDKATVEWGTRAQPDSTSPVIPSSSKPPVLVASPEPERPDEVRTDSPAGGKLSRPQSAPLVPPQHDAQTAPPYLGRLHRGISPVHLNPKYSLGQRRPMESTPEEEGNDTGYVAPSPQPAPQEAEEEEAEEKLPGKAEMDAGGEADSDPGWGRNFKLQWLSTVHLPFQRTRHIRNAWNRNREVKVSRDGTEIEPVAGQLLLAEWK
ncbi:YT521-B-like domain-containing protein [Roridomyces roridus]|uniref:YT521-B-like domain-containing protein n=1 Tax=Roridomyces roridus TaxID=1738132 RepID=A0AAD7BR08_9AGAR|nr:YT521-B-like domain-containing protein [Roridomyces roridus]